MLAPNESKGYTTEPGKGVGDGVTVEVEVGSGVCVCGIGDVVCEGVTDGGRGGVVVDGAFEGVSEAQPLKKITRNTIKRIAEFMDLFISFLHSTK